MTVVHIEGLRPSVSVRTCQSNLSLVCSGMMFDCKVLQSIAVFRNLLELLNCGYMCSFCRKFIWLFFVDDVSN